MTHIHIEYTNWRGIHKSYDIVPIENTLRFGSNVYHPTQQWLIDAVDLDRHVTSRGRSP